MNRILVLGNAGSGKSRLTNSIGTILQLPVHHLDAYFWLPGWKQSDFETFRGHVVALAAGEAWVIDGNYVRTLAERIAVADTVLLLRPPKLLCILRVILRGLRERGQARSDLPAGCREQIPSPDFLRWIWRFDRDELPRILTLIDQAGGRATVQTFRTSREVQEYLTHLNSAAGQSSNR